jgi:bacitracin transport system ATP-binding protein
LEADFHTSNFHIDDDHNLRLYDTEIDVGTITRKWIESGLNVSEAHTQNDTLEDYFKQVTGGGGIA